MLQCIGKRAWKESDLTTTIEPDKRRERTSRCRYYWHVEDRCFSKLPSHPQLPPYYGTFTCHDQLDWMVFDMVGDPALSLADYMKRDWDEGNGGLPNLRQAMNRSSDADALDTILESLS